MAWPPGTLPTNRTNATPQTNTHPADHNAVNGAVNDIVNRVLSIESGLVTVNHASGADYSISYQTPNAVFFRWDPDPSPGALYFKIDDNVWFKIAATPIAGDPP